MTSLAEDLERDIHCILGLPIDRIGLEDALAAIHAAVAARRPFLVSTPNINFVVQSRSDPELRRSVIESDLSLADGAPIVVIARLLGSKLPGRVAGSDLVEALQADRQGRRLKTFLFGGMEGVAERACARLEDSQGGLRCVGTHNPGFGTLNEISSPELIGKINDSGADFLLVALGAAKGQKWLLRNHDRLDVAVRSHLGATLNFLAGTIARAPKVFRSTGMEWLWRIKEEPQLARRYGHDGLALLGLLAIEVVPLLLQRAWRTIARTSRSNLVVTRAEREGRVHLELSGPLVGETVDQLKYILKRESQARLVVEIDGVKRIDSAGAGLLLVLWKHCKEDRLNLKGSGARLRRLLRPHGVEFILDGDST